MAITTSRRGVPDVSEHNPPLTPAFDGDFIIIRATFGANYLDQHFLHNTSVAKQLHAQGQLAGVILYHVVLRTDSVAAQDAALWGAVGPTVPDWLAGIEWDVETWRGESYEQHGDMSDMTNALAAKAAARFGTWDGQIAYANRSDFNELCPRLDPRIRTNLASYGDGRLMMGMLPRQIAHQYTDGQYMPPPGYVSASAPFGPCDHNAFPAYPDGHTLRAALRPTPPPPGGPVTDDMPTSGPWAEEWSNPETATKTAPPVKRRAAGWLLRVVQQNNAILAQQAAILEEVAAIRALLNTPPKGP